MAVVRAAGGPGGRGSARFTWNGATVQRAWEAQIQAGLEAEAAHILGDLRSSIHVISGDMRDSAFATVDVRGTKRTIVAGASVDYAIYEEARHPQIRRVVDAHAPHVTQQIAAGEARLMPVQTRPNLLSALRTQLLSFPEVTALVSGAAGWTDGRTEPRIASQLHDLWAMPTRAVRVRRTGGPLVENDASMGLWRARVDLFCYGGHPHEAQALIDVVLPALIPLQGTPAGFTHAGCRVALIEPEADCFTDVDPATGWPFAWAPLSVLWVGVSV